MKNVSWGDIALALIVMSIAGCTAAVHISSDSVRRDTIKACLETHTPDECDKAAPFFD